MPRHFKIDDLLSETDRAELVELVRKRSTTVDAVWSWLRTRGHKVSRGAAHNWMREVKAADADPTTRVRDELLRLISRMTAEQMQGLLELARDSRAARFSQDNGQPAVTLGSKPV